MSSRFHRAVGVIVMILGIIPATAYSVSVIDEGWISSSGFSLSSLQNYGTGKYGGNTVRSYYVFDLSNTTPLSGVALSIPGNGLISPQGFETLTLFDISPGNISCLLAANCGVPGYDDAGTGVQYGSLDISSGTGDQVIVFNFAGRDAFNAAAGNGFFAVGAALTSLDGTGDEIVNYQTRGYGPYPQVQLVEATPPVPVPAAVWLFGSGLIALAGVARRRTAQTCKQPGATDKRERLANSSAP
jgi:hypothetical protein